MPGSIDQFQEMNMHFTTINLTYHRHKLIIHISCHYLLSQCRQAKKAVLTKKK